MKNYWAILAKKWICFNDNSTEVFLKRRIYICKIYRDSILRIAKRKTDGTKLLSTFLIRESFLTFAKIDIFYENTRSTKKSLGENFSLSLTNFLFFSSMFSVRIAPVAAASAAVPALAGGETTSASAPAETSSVAPAFGAGYPVGGLRHRRSGRHLMARYNTDVSC